MAPGQEALSRLNGQETGIGRYEADTPCLLLDIGRVEANIRRMAEQVAEAGVALRPHAKTHKLPQVARLQLAAGCAGLTVAKLGEAEMFADHGVADLFVAYPVWGERKWERLCALAERVEVRVGADSFGVFAGISEAACARGLSIPVRIEVDTGFGRCGVQSAREAYALADRLTQLKGVQLVGLMSFAGQTYQSPDHVREAALLDAQRLVAVAEELRGRGIELPEISVGSTPSATIVHDLSGITEIRPGTYVFSDRDQVALGWGTLADCALTALATVVSCPTATRAVIDAGTKTLSSDRASTVDGWGVVRDRPGWSIMSLSEEHAILEVPAGEATIGTVVEIVPNHACGMLNMHDWVAVVRDDTIEDWWHVAGRGLIR